MMMMITAPVGLIILLLTFHSFNTISAKTCRSSSGRTRQCEEDQSCCRDNNGQARCCSGDFPWWAGLIFGLIVVGGTALSITIFCCCLKCAKKRKRHAEIVQPVRRFEPSTGSGTVHFTRVETSLNNTETNTSTDAPPSYSDVSQSSPSTGSGTIRITTVETSLNNTETNTTTNAPPSYSDVNQSSEQLPPPYPRIL